MRVLLVHPGYYDPDGVLIKLPHRKGYVSSFVLPYLAAMFSSDVDVEIVEETLQDIDFNKPYDLVGISVSTPIAMRAYEIAKRFRDKKIPVVLGGYHVALCPDEAEEHADAIIIGEAEPVWKNFLSDWQSGHLKKRYTANVRFDMKGMVFPRYDLIDYRKYSTFYGTLVSVEASRGCPNRCDFCSTPRVDSGGIIYRPTEEVVADIKRIQTDCKFIRWPAFVFIDDNMTADFQKLENLFKALIPLRIRWLGFVSFPFCKNKSLVRLARQSGCYSVFLGMESIQQSVLNQMHKRFNDAREMPMVVKTLIENDILLMAGIMIGLPQDTQETFDQTINFLIDNSVATAQIRAPYPFPNTLLFNKLKAEGRLYDEKFWLKAHNPYELFRRDFFPVDGQSFYEGFRKSVDRYITVRSVIRRSWAYKKYFIPLLAYNLAYRRLVREQGIVVFT